MRTLEKTKNYEVDGSWAHDTSCVDYIALTEWSCRCYYVINTLPGATPPGGSLEDHHPGSSENQHLGSTEHQLNQQYRMESPARPTRLFLDNISYLLTEKSAHLLFIRHEGEMGIGDNAQKAYQELE